MTAKVIDGKQVAADIRAELKLQIESLKSRGVVPGLGVILVGDDPASVSYVTGKERTCDELGIYSDHNHLPAATTQSELLAVIARLNKDPRINGILVQLPLPGHLDELAAIFAIDPSKDVDGIHPVSIGKMVTGQKAFLSCTPHGVVQLLMRGGVKIDGSHVVIVGRSNIVGKPLANMLFQKSPTGNATVTVCHTGTKNLASYTRQADILIAAMGRPRTITADMVKEGAAVIDVGVSRVDDPSKKAGFRLVGDVDFDAVKEKASLITPVPGGVGPMTITMLMYNTVESARLAAGV
jgi:methylenetetrahydrofolate dehydrogenase (NADP+) / methenyltetrahydrofolate cyclohydrolase